jgi:hypothetical protein
VRSAISKPILPPASSASGEQLAGPAVSSLAGVENAMELLHVGTRLPAAEVCIDSFLASRLGSPRCP